MGSWFAVVLGLLFIASGAGILYISIRTASGEISRNRRCGIRISSTMASDAAWAAGHRAALIPSSLAAGQMTLTGMVLLFVSNDDTARLLVLLSSGLLVVGIGVAAFLANQAATAIDTEENDAPSDPFS